MLKRPHKVGWNLFATASNRNRHWVCIEWINEWMSLSHTIAASLLCLANMIRTKTTTPKKKTTNKSFSICNSDAPAHMRTTWSVRMRESKSNQKEILAFAEQRKYYVVSMRRRTQWISKHTRQSDWTKRITREKYCRIGALEADVENVRVRGLSMDLIKTHLI